MALNADTLLDRMHLKNQASRWRLIALAVGLLAVLLVTLDKADFAEGRFGSDYIARFTVSDIIYDDIDRHEMLVALADDPHLKALILRMDSPGGSTVGSEQLYLDLRRIAKKVPVVCTMRSYAASGGYLSSLGADYILARQGTLTGSIGVILQTAEVTELAKKLGVTPITVKSGPLKASPTLFEKFTGKEEALLQSIIGDFQHYFLKLVQKRRKLTDEQIAQLADGRAVSAPQALKLGLIDAIGGEEEALEWLESEKEVDSTLEVRDVEVEIPLSPLEEFLQGAVSKSFLNRIFGRPGGLISLWQPGMLPVH